MADTTEYTLQPRVSTLDFTGSSFRRSRGEVMCRNKTWNKVVVPAIEVVVLLAIYFTLSRFIYFVENLWR